MEKTLLALLLTLVCVSGYSQKAYRKLSEFKGDTVEYIKVNFDDNKARYVGQKFEKLIADYELSLQEGHALGTSPWLADSYGKSYLCGFDLSYLDYNHFKMYNTKKTRHASVFIDFRGPHTKEETPISRLISERGRTKAAIIELIGDYIVEDIEVVVYN